MNDEQNDNDAKPIALQTEMDKAVSALEGFLTPEEEKVEQPIEEETVEEAVMECANITLSNHWVDWDKAQHGIYQSSKCLRRAIYGIDETIVYKWRDRVLGMEQNQLVVNIIEELTHARLDFDTWESEEYISMLESSFDKIKLYIDKLKVQEAFHREQHISNVSALRKHNLTVIFALVKLVTLANRAKQRVQHEYAPTMYRGQRCIEEFRAEFCKTTGEEY
tara:strand:+ start:65 stop:727 length:663 start_codon:yes stop_codon:yes gene_type:complete